MQYRPQIMAVGSITDVEDKGDGITVIIKGWNIDLTPPPGSTPADLIEWNESELRAMTEGD